jgi:plasmid stability protein
VAQILVRSLDEDVKRRLQQRAARHGKSMEEEARDILRAAVSREVPRKAQLGSAIAARFAKIGLEEPLPEMRGHKARPAKLGR